MTLTTRTLAAALAALTLTVAAVGADAHGRGGRYYGPGPFWGGIDRKSTRLNSSHQ